MENKQKQEIQSLEKQIKNHEEVEVIERGFLASLFAPKYKVVSKSTGEVLKRKSETYAMKDGNRGTFHAFRQRKRDGRILLCRQESYYAGASASLRGLRLPTGHRNGSVQG